MADDLSDAFREIRELKRQVKRLQAARPLENASITNGRVRFVGGTLRVDSGGRVEIVGTLQIDGTTTVTGSFKVTGPWRLEGDGTITGNVTGTGTLTWNGPWNLNGAGKIQGDVQVLGAGKLRVGNMVLDPTVSGGAIAFANGAQVFTDATTIQVYKGNGVAQISDTEAKLQVGGLAIRIVGGNVQFLGLPTRSRANANNAVVGSIWSDGTNVYRVVS
ncbi:hypothetical protein [Microbacterium algeriense]|uniref:hypothetical protein n=1 Tax=Microbacterium algeriense TaxID=2615184 RepID=UPI003D75748A